jgi:hypothetical protein
MDEAPDTALHAFGNDAAQCEIDRGRTSLSFVLAMMDTRRAGAAPVLGAPVAVSMMAVLKCSWLKEAATLRRMRNISRYVSSLPNCTSKSFHSDQKASSMRGSDSDAACTYIARARSISPT